VDHIFFKIISYFHKCKHKHSTFARITIKGGRVGEGLITPTDSKQIVDDGP
jgi:hypothetical protein